MLAFDADNGVIECEGTIQWPALLAQLAVAQDGRERQWGIYQKQTGADRLSLGGALAGNAHGRGLTPHLRIPERPVPALPRRVQCLTVEDTDERA